MDKRQQLVTTAFTLFYRHGIHAVGINQILTESGVAKKTLYHHFPGKEALVAAVLEHRDSAFLAWLDGRLRGSEQTVTGVIEALFAALDDWFNDRETPLAAFHGCFFINTCGEYGEPGHELHRQCARHKEAVVALLAHYLQRAGQPAPDADRLAQTLGLLKEGAIVLAHVQGDKRAALTARELALRLANTGTTQTRSPA